MQTTEERKETRVTSFSELPVSGLIKQNLERMGITTPTPIQAGVIEPALEGKDVLGTAQTGTGKTLAFAIPILEDMMKHPGKGVQALVLVPTRELATQVLDVFAATGKGSGLMAALVVGGLSEVNQLRAIKQGAQLIIATPGRLHDYVKRNLVDLSHVRTLVLDEADRMVDMGFLPQMRIIMNVVVKDRQTMCFSATLDREVSHLVHAYLKNPVRIEIGSTLSPAESIHLRIYEVIREQRLGLLLHLLATEPGSYLVFTRTKHGADKLVRKLTQNGHDAGVLHGGKTQGQRTRALDLFKQGKHRVLVATDIAARGIHVDSIAHVINFDMPQVPEDFVHRVGRTGRAEETGVATTFVMPEEIGEIYGIEKKLGRKIQRIPLPANLQTEPRNLHDEYFDARARPGFRSHAPRRFGGRGGGGARRRR